MALSSFDAFAFVAQHLPFHLNETDKVNAAFQRWRQNGDDEARYHIDLWTYCFIHRYFLVKFTHDTRFTNPADMDALIERGYNNVLNHQTTVSDSASYSSWVSVVCKHVCINYLRRNHQTVSLGKKDEASMQGDSLEALFDIGILHQGLHEAVARLPDFLRDIARYRFIEGYSYQEIGELVDKPLPTVRSYVNKAVRKLREDSIFLAYLPWG